MWLPGVRLSRFGKRPSKRMRTCKTCGRQSRVGAHSRGNWMRSDWRARPTSAVPTSAKEFPYWDFIRRGLAVFGVILACLASSSCSLTSPPSDVFVPFHGMSFMFPMHNHDILDLGVSQLHSQGTDPVRITGVKLINTPKVVHPGRVDAFTYQQTHGGVYGEIGDLPALCPKLFVRLPRPYPVIKPGRDATYYLTIQVRIRRPGAYKVHAVQVSYVDLKTHEAGAQVMDPNVLVRVKRGPAQIYPKSVCNT